MNVLVTGCSSGLGLSLVENLTMLENVNIIATARNLDKLELLHINAPYGNVFKCQLDVTSCESINKCKNFILNKFNKLHVLINNAGVDFFSTFNEADSLNIERIFNTNLFGVISVIRHMMPLLTLRDSDLYVRNSLEKESKNHNDKSYIGRETNGGGLIVNISSQSALSWSVGSIYYSITKHALDGLSINLAAENRYYKNNVKVLTVNCGPFKSNIFNNDLSGKFVNLKKFPRHFKDSPSEFSRIIINALSMYSRGELFNNDYYRRIVIGESAIAKARWLRNHIDYSIKLSKLVN